ncbi:MAG: alanine racemase [Alphaproteobacteria bacterium]|nr:alanine racemase [Alphaproteobacteria bacterium]
MAPTSRALTSLTIDLDAIAANYRRIQSRLTTPCECAAVVKANAYGLGALEVAAKLYAVGCRTFFVATVDEGLALRQEFEDATPGQQPQIVVLGGPSIDAVDALVSGWLTPVLSTPEHVDLWREEASNLGRALPAVVHVDTGMNRLGFTPEEWAGSLNEPRRWTGIDVRLLMSHLACADEPSHPKNEGQRRAFDRCRKRLPATRASLANSAGVLCGPAFHYDLVRPGIALYGGNPLNSDVNEFSQVIVLESKIVQIHEIDSPQTVGYGATHTVTGPSRIATVGVGYADGYPRSLSNAGFAFLGGVRVPVVGRVSMDLMTLDVSAVPGNVAYPGATIELIGPNAPVDALALTAGTISYELLTRLGCRYERRYTGSVR